MLIPVVDNLPTTRPEALLGARVRVLRQARDWSQDELARRMAAVGYPWWQSTTAKTEAANRPMRLDEAAALAGVLGVRLAELIEPEAHHPAVERLHRLGSLVHAARIRAREKADELRTTERELEGAHDLIKYIEGQVALLAPLVERVAGGGQLTPEEVRALVNVFWGDDEWRVILSEFDVDEAGHAIAEAEADDLRAEQITAEEDDSGQRHPTT